MARGEFITKYIYLNKWVEISNSNSKTKGRCLNY